MVCIQIAITVQITYKMENSKISYKSVDITKIYPYYRADLLAAHFMEAGCDANQVIISRRSALGQCFLHDIEEVSMGYSNLNPNNTYINIKSGRPGMYDSLPEGLFYTSANTEQKKDNTDIIKEIHERKEIESHLRLFMKLFEVEVDYFRTELQAEELRYNKSHIHRQYINIFLAYWPEITLMTQSEALRFLKIVPAISSIRGNYKEIARAVSFIMNVPVLVKIDLSAEVEDDMPMRREMSIHAPSGAVSGQKCTTAPLLILSSMSLGVNFILADNSLQKPHNIHLILCCSTGEDCGRYLIGEQKYHIVIFLAELLFEADIPFAISVTPAEECRHFYIGATYNSCQTYLGVNTSL